MVQQIVLLHKTSNYNFGLSSVKNRVLTLIEKVPTWITNVFAISNNQHNYSRITTVRMSSSNTDRTTTYYYTYQWHAPSKHSHEPAKFSVIRAAI